MTKSRKNLRAVGKVALYVVGIIVAYALIVAVLSRIPFNRNTVPGVDVVAYRTVMFYVICFIAMLPWVAAEWILCKEVVRVCRDAGKRRRAKILAVITAAADIPLVCLSLYIAFGLATMPACSTRSSPRRLRRVQCSR